MKDKFDPGYLRHAGTCQASALHLLALLALTVLAGCSTPKAGSALVHPSDFVRQRYSFIADGQTTREEVLLRLGIPSAKFEGERILTYQLVMDKSGGWYLHMPVRDKETGMRVWADNTCSLVFSFNAIGVLERHSLVLPNSFKEPNI
jgi:hypothetical protein